MSKMIFVNLPVRDIGAATRFYAALGCVQNGQFSTENSSAMVYSETITFQLQSHDHYSTFTARTIADARTTSAALYGLAQDSRAAVDAVVQAGAAAGGKADVREPQDMGFMYVRSVEDPDGNVFEAIWMDASALSGAA